MGLVQFPAILSSETDYAFLIKGPDCQKLKFYIKVQGIFSQDSGAQLKIQGSWATDPLLSPRTTKLWRGYRVCPVRMYVSTYVRSFVCSPFVIAFATSFFIQFRYYFTQILNMTLPRTSSRFSMIGSRSRSQ